MAGSRHPNPFGLGPLSLDFEFLPSRTPGCLGINDAADPDARCALGDTPGPLGIFDHADPTAKHLLVPPLLPLYFEETEEYKQFESKALAQQISNAKARGRQFSSGVPEDELELVD